MANRGSNICASTPHAGRRLQGYVMLSQDVQCKLTGSCAQVMCFPKAQWYFRTTGKFKILCLLRFVNNKDCRAITHDEKMYPNPTKFMPERFLVEDPPLDPKLYAFGSGRRRVRVAAAGKVCKSDPKDTGSALAYCLPKRLRS